MNLITIRDFANEKGVSPINIYKLVASRKIEYVTKMDGIKKPFLLYDKNELERMFSKRRDKQPPKQKDRINVSKLW
jgi:hypothetical protein